MSTNTRKGPRKGEGKSLTDDTHAIWRSTGDLTGVVSDILPWLELSSAIIERACNDVVWSNNPRIIHDAESFFLSEWFSELSDMDPYYLLRALRKKRAERIEQGRFHGNSRTVHAARKEPDNLVEVDGKKYKTKKLK